VALALLGFTGSVVAQTLEPPFDADYSLVDLGPVPGLPPPNGGLTVVPGDPATLLIGGEANFDTGMLYAVPLVRDTNGHITGFAAGAQPAASAPYNDGGVAFGPGGVLFLSRFPMNEIGQIMPGSIAADRVVDLAALGVVESPGGLNFVPTGFPGEGQLKLASWQDGEWYSLALASDGLGTFDVTSATPMANIPGGPEGFIYVTAGSPGFTDYSHMLVSEWTDGNIVVYTIDANGDPLPSTRQVFISGLLGAEGAAIDPLTGDFLFSTFSLNDDRVIAVRGFAPPPPPDNGDGDPQCLDVHPVGQGYWHRQCMAIPISEGGLRPEDGTYRGPREVLEPGFDALRACADEILPGLGFSGVTTCDGLDPSHPKDVCLRALKRLTALVLNVCSERVSTSCALDVSPEGCDATTVGELLEEAAGWMHEGYCHLAAVCLAAANERQALDR
jgi:hypothetical protein